MSTPAVMHSHSLAQTTVFPSPLRALVSRQHGNEHPPPGPWSTPPPDVAFSFLFCFFDLGQGAAMIITAFAPFRFFAQRCCSPSSLRALTSRRYSNKYHHHYLGFRKESTARTLGHELGAPVPEHHHPVLGLCLSLQRM